MDLLSSRLTRLYHGLVRVFFAVCAVWLFVSCLVCTNFLDLEERSHLTADNVQLQAVLLLILGALCILVPRPQKDRLYSVLRWVLVGIGGALGLLAQAENTINPVPGNPEGAPEPQHGTEKPQQSAIDEGGVQHQGEHHKP